MRTWRGLAVVLGFFLAGGQTVNAEPTPKIDWKQLEDSMGQTGDHIVGDEICARLEIRPLAF